MLRSAPWMWLLIALAAAAAGDARAEEAGARPGGMRYIYNRPESALDQRYEYQWEILRTALERTREKWGAFAMEPGVLMSEKRQTFELMHATGKLTVMYLGTTPELEKALTPVRIPVDK